MTTICVRDGWIAADSRETVEGEGGDYCRTCEKIFEVELNGLGLTLVGLSGESAPGLLFLDWMRGYCRDGALRDMLRESDADFTALVCYGDGRVLEFDAWCVGQEVTAEFHASGSGSKAALGAMHAGADAMTACRIAAKLDPYTGGEIKARQFCKTPKPTSESL